MACSIQKMVESRGVQPPCVPQLLIFVQKKISNVLLTRHVAVRHSMLTWCQKNEVNTKFSTQQATANQNHLFGVVFDAVVRGGM